MHTEQSQYVNARLIDGTGAAPVEDAVLAVADDGTIRYAGPAGNAPAAAPGETSVDLGGRTLLPGFFDCHVHFGLGSGGGPTAVLMSRPSTLLFESARLMRETLHAGITTARDLGGIDAGCREAVARGLIEGPRLQVAVRVVGHTGGHADFTLPSGLRLFEEQTALVDSPDEARLQTRKLLRDGADVIKVCATGGMSSPTDQPEDEGLTEEEIRTVVEEAARNRGCPVAAHAQGTTGIHHAIRGGVASVEHGYGLDAGGRDLMLEHGTVLVPTLSTGLRMPARGTVPEYQWQKKARWTAAIEENIAAAIAADVPVALGTDSGVCPHGANLRELGHLVGLGMRPMDALLAGTRNAARLLGLESRLGTLEPGKLADFVVTATDPLTDIASLATPDTIVLVAQSGEIRKNTLPSAAPGPAPARLGSRSPSA
ncbi:MULTISPECIES: metal-dependent hydrolase family protein [Streptomyces]|uniref:metal-dependent hydrolase family protein n=1 Tax=Streptomyces TaxID=1883 RepID=UPI000B9EA16E|nr:amidohydrolase family protein [Streptomyces kasugaensis]